MRTTDHDDISLDFTIFCERLAERLRSRGASHPVAAAVALAARGQRGVDVDEFAAALGIDGEQLRQIETGNVAFADVPDELAFAFADIPSARLLLMADLDREMATEKVRSHRPG